MKKTFTLFFALCLFSMISQGQVLLDEIFNYSVSNLAQEPTWTTNPAGTPPVVGTGRNIVTPALTYITTDGTYILSDKGKTIKSDYASGAADYWSYKKFIATSINSGKVYLSFMLKPGAAQKQSQSEVFGIGDSLGSGSGPKVWIGKGTVTANFKLGTTRGSGTGADIKWRTAEFTDTLATMLVVLKYDFTTTTSYLFVNPTLGSTVEPTPDAFDDVSSTIRTQLGSIRFRVNGNNRAYFNVSGARVSQTWAEAVARVSLVGTDDPIEGKNNLKIYHNSRSGMMNMDYRLAENTRVNLVLYNITGQVVKTFINNSSQPAGSYSKSFDVSDLKSGIYLARYTAGSRSQTVKLVINK